VPLHRKKLPPVQHQLRNPAARIPEIGATFIKFRSEMAHIRQSCNRVRQARDRGDGLIGPHAPPPTDLPERARGLLGFWGSLDECSTMMPPAIDLITAANFNRHHNHDARLARGPEPIDCVCARARRLSRSRSDHRELARHAQDIAQA